MGQRQARKGQRGTGPGRCAQQAQKQLQQQAEAAVDWQKRRQHSRRDHTKAQQQDIRHHPHGKQVAQNARTADRHAVHQKHRHHAHRGKPGPHQRDRQLFRCPAHGAAKNRLRLLLQPFITLPVKAFGDHIAPHHAERRRKRQLHADVTKAKRICKADQNARNRHIGKPVGALDQHGRRVAQNGRNARTGHRGSKSGKCHHKQRNGHGGQRSCPAAARIGAVQKAAQHGHMQAGNHQ